MTSIFKSVVIFILTISLLANGIYSAHIKNNDILDEPYITLQGIKVYDADHSCGMLGGFCVHTNDCKARTSKHGLCPSYAQYGVECCYELHSRPAPCHEHLGACMNYCAKDLQRPGTDCTNGDVCCVLI